MKIIKRFKCDFCGYTVEPNEGFIFHGNVYVVDEDVDVRRGIIGNNFPRGGGLNNFLAEDVDETVLCKSCMRNTFIDKDYNL